MLSVEDHLGSCACGSCFACRVATVLASGAGGIGAERRPAVFALFYSTSSQEVDLKNAKTDYDAHCTAGVVIAFAFFKPAGFAFFKSTS